MSKTSGVMGDFRPIMPSLIRLIAGVIVVLVLQSVILGFPGITQNVPSTSLTMSSLVTVTLGLIATVVVLKFGTKLSNAIGDVYSSIKNYTPLLAFFFQVVAVWILYNACRAISRPLFTSVPWAYPLAFLALAMIPTIRAVVSVVRALEGHSVKRTVSRDQY